MAAGCCQACGHQDGLKPAWPAQLVKPAGPQPLLGQDPLPAPWGHQPDSLQDPSISLGPCKPPRPSRAQPADHSPLHPGSLPCATPFLLRLPTPGLASLPWPHASVSPQIWQDPHTDPPQMSHLFHGVCQLLTLFILLALGLWDMGSPGLFFCLQAGAPEPSLAPFGEH